MTESVFSSRDDARRLFDEQPAQPMEHVDVLGGGADGRRWRKPIRASAWRSPTMRSTT